MSYDFDDSTRYLAGVFGSTLTLPLSLVAWIKCNNASWETTSKDWIIMLSEGSPADEAFTLGKTQGSAERVTASARAGGSENNATENHADNQYNDTWVMVAATFTNSSLRDVYVEISTETGQATGTRNVDPVDDIRIGSAINGFNNLAGLGAEFAVFDITLTTDMIDDLQTAAETGVAPNTVAPGNCIGYWPLLVDQSSHADQSGNGGPTLTVTGAVFSSDHPTILAAGTEILVPTGPIR